jgi:hypothetical protein
MGGGLGPRQREALGIVNAQGRVTVAELADALGVTARRTREVIASLRLRRLVAVTRERIGTQASGLPVNGLVVWTASALFARDADRVTADLQARAIALSERAARERASRCPCCGQLTVPTGSRRRFAPVGPLSSPRPAATMDSRPGRHSRSSRRGAIAAPVSGHPNRRRDTP